MEILLKWLDDIDDAVSVLRTHFRPLLATALLFLCFASGIVAFLLFTQPELLAAP